MVNAWHRSLSDQGAAACLRARSTDPLRSLSASEFVALGRRFLEITKYIAATCSCCKAMKVKTRYANSSYPRTGTQVGQHSPPIHTLSPIITWLPVSYQVGSGEPSTVDRNVRMGAVVRREVLWTRRLRGNLPINSRHPHRPPSAGTSAGWQRCP